MTTNEIIQQNQELQLRYAKAINTITILERKLEKLQKENERLKDENRRLKRQNNILMRAIEIALHMSKEKQDLDLNEVLEHLKDIEKSR